MINFKEVKVIKINRGKTGWCSILFSGIYGENVNNTLMVSPNYIEKHIDIFKATNEIKKEELHATFIVNYGKFEQREYKGKTYNNITYFLPDDIKIEFLAKEPTKKKKEEEEEENEEDDLVF